MASYEQTYQEVQTEGLKWRVMNDLEGRPAWVMSSFVELPEKVGGYWSAQIDLPRVGQLPQLPWASWVYKDHYSTEKGSLQFVDSVNGAKRRLKNVLDNLVQRAKAPGVSVYDVCYGLAQEGRVAAQEMEQARRKR